MDFNEETQKFVSIKDKVPFYMLHNTVIAPNKNYLVGDFAVFNLNENMYFINGSKVITTMIADFGDGINRTLINKGVLQKQEITIKSTAKDIFEAKVPFNLS